MPPRDPNLPEGTDSFIDDTADLGGSGGVASGDGTFTDDNDFSSTAGSSGLDSAAGSFSSDANAGFGASTGSMGGTTSMTGETGMGSTLMGGSASPMINSSDVQSLKTQASDKIRDVASQGKERATEALTNVTQLINETAETVDERLGAQYGDYVRRAATAVEGLGTSIQSKEVDELFDDARNFVRRSPGVALGAAAAVGFLLVRLVKSGMPATSDDNNYRSTSDYSGASTQRLASPPRVDNSFDPVA